MDGIRADVVALVQRVDALQHQLEQSERLRHVLEQQMLQQRQVEQTLQNQVENLRSGKRGVKYSVGISANSPDEATLMLNRLQNNVP